MSVSVTSSDQWRSLTSAILMISMVAVIAPLPGRGTPLRASLSRINVVLNTSFAMIATLDEDSSILVGVGEAEVVRGADPGASAGVDGRAGMSADDTAGTKEDDGG